MVHVNADHELALASHVRACECDGHVILLDLRRSRYLGISGLASQVLAQRLQRWPFNSEYASASLSSSATADLLHKLISQGLVVEATNAGTANTNNNIAPYTNLTSGIKEATSTIELDQELGQATEPGMSKPSRTATHVRRSLQFACSVVTAACWIRCRSLQSIASHVARRRARLHEPKTEAMEAMKPALAAYEGLRPFVFTARDECLLDSLALVNFLAHDGLAPRWVLGVKTGPFGAHAWVQAGHTVLNDQHEYVRQFRPILVV